jgi:transketolase
MTYRLNDKEIKKLESTADQIRLSVIDVIYKIGGAHRAHVSPALSIVEIITCLYFKVLNLDPKNPKWPDRDRFILSKGHACGTLYVALARKGFFDSKHLYTWRHIGSILQGHPDMRKTPGVDMTTGSLGNGLAAGVGMALSARMDNRDYKTYVVLGDGETQEGLVWEAAMTAGHYKLNNLIVIIDRNKYQGTGKVDCVIDIEPLAKKFESFNWNVLEVDGHSIPQILEALNYNTKEKPLAIIANTTKGKGISFMEHNNSWHQRPITDEEYSLAIKELKRGNANE